jgi:hypothetical protein
MEGVARDERMKWMQASRSMIFVLSGPPLPPAPVEIIRSGFLIPHSQK